MARWWLSAFCVVVAVLAPGRGAMAAEEPCRLKARWDQQPPYGVRLPDGRRSGYYAETVREAARRIGCEVEFVEMPWARGLSELEAGRIDLMAGALRTPERQRFARFTRPINLSPNLLFLRAEAVAGHPMDRLVDLMDTDLRVGIEAGAFYGPDYERLVAYPRFAARLHPVADRPRGWMMLREGRLDGIFSDQATAFVEGIGLPSGESLVPVLVVSARPAHVMVGRHRPADLVRRLDRAIGAMIDEGWLPQLREAWIPCEADPVTMGCRTGKRIEAASPPPGAAGGRDLPGPPTSR